MDVECTGQDRLQITEEKELLAWADKRLEHVVDGIVLLKHKLLFIDLNCPLEVNAVVKKFHQRLHVQLVLHFITVKRLDILLKLPWQLRFRGHLIRHIDFVEFVLFLMLCILKVKTSVMHARLELCC